MAPSMTFLLFRAIRGALGKAASLAETEAQHLYWDAQPYPKICWICGKSIRRKQRSIDHVIPRSVCWELGLYKLIYDHRNFKLAHKTCNTLRSNNMNMVPDSVIAKLGDLGYTREG